MKTSSLRRRLSSIATNFIHIIFKVPVKILWNANNFIIIEGACDFVGEIVFGKVRLPVHSVCRGIFPSLFFFDLCCC